MNLIGAECATWPCPFGVRRLRSTCSTRCGREPRVLPARVASLLRSLPGAEPRCTCACLVGPAPMWHGHVCVPRWCVSVCVCGNLRNGGGHVFSWFETPAVFTILLHLGTVWCLPFRRNLNDHRLRQVSCHPVGGTATHAQNIRKPSCLVSEADPSSFRPQIAFFLCKVRNPFPFLLTGVPWPFPFADTARCRFSGTAPSGKRSLRRAKAAAKHPHVRSHIHNAPPLPRPASPKALCVLVGVGGGGAGSQRSARLLGTHRPAAAGRAGWVAYAPGAPRAGSVLPSDSALQAGGRDRGEWQRLRQCGGGRVPEMIEQLGDVTGKGTGTGKGGPP